jgi:hypothetical protein
VDAFKELKAALTKALSLHHIQVDKPFVLRTDASGYAIGAVLEQEKDGALVPVCFCSRKLTTSQRNWTPREQETYAIIMALRKWAGWIGFHPVLVLTDHRSLENWTKEFVDTPSGPAARRARWHETLSRFQIEVKYIPGKNNVVADAMSRWAYPAGKALADVSKHGSIESTREAHATSEEEKREEREDAQVDTIQEEEPQRMLDLFSGTGSVGQVYKDRGWEVITLDMDPKHGADIREDVLTWRYTQYPPGYFHTIAAGIPCTEFSQALTTRPRDMEKGDALAQKALEIIRYFQPQRWFMENPRNGWLPTREYMKGLPYVDVDYCQFAEWGYQKPTRIWGSPDIGWLDHRKCDGKTCPNLAQGGPVRAGYPRRHEEKLGGKELHHTAIQKGRIPSKLVEYLAGFRETTAQTMPKGEERTFMSTPHIPEWEFKRVPTAYEVKVCERNQQKNNKKTTNQEE